MSSGTTHQSGLSFGPTKSGKRYISVYYHRQPNRSKDKCIWKIPPSQEYEIFSQADDRNWQDQDGHYWGVHDQGETSLGTGDERICKFPRTSNASDSWHGYPVGHAKDTPSDEFINNWIENKVISRKIGRHIQRGTL